MWLKVLGVAALFAAVSLVVSSGFGLVQLVLATTIVIIGLLLGLARCSLELDLDKRQGYSSFSLFKFSMQSKYRDFNQLSLFVSPYQHISFTYQLQIEQHCYPIGSLTETKELATEIMTCSGIKGYGRASSGGKNIALAQLHDVIVDRTEPLKLWSMIELGRLIYPLFISLLIVSLARLL